MKTIARVLMLMLLAGAPVHAHHSFGFYDMTASAQIEGTVQKFEWTNPHCWLFVTVDGAEGASVTYGFELSSVGEMLRHGWKKTTLKPGDRVRVQYRPMKDGTPAGLMTTAFTPDGQPIGQKVR